MCQSVRCTVVCLCIGAFVVCMHYVIVCMYCMVTTDLTCRCVHTVCEYVCVCVTMPENGLTVSLYFDQCIKVFVSVCMFTTSLWFETGTWFGSWHCMEYRDQKLPNFVKGPLSIPLYLSLSLPHYIGHHGPQKLQNK